MINFLFRQKKKSQINNTIPPCIFDLWEHGHRDVDQTADDRAPLHLCGGKHWVRTSQTEVKTTLGGNSRFAEPKCTEI